MAQAWQINSIVLLNLSIGEGMKKYNNGQHLGRFMYWITLRKNKNPTYIGPSCSVSALWKLKLSVNHSVAAISMIEPQLDMAKWWSKRSMFPHSLPRCGWIGMGTTSFYLGISYVHFVPKWLSVIRRAPKYQYQHFQSCPKYHSKSLKKACGFKYLIVWLFAYYYDGWELRNSANKANISESFLFW